MTSSKLRGLRRIAVGRRNAFCTCSTLVRGFHGTGHADVNLFGFTRVLRSVPILRGVLTLWGLGQRLSSFMTEGLRT
jgi:hypothetical protein